MCIIILTLNHFHKSMLNGNSPEWYAYNEHERHVFIEDKTLRTTEIIDPSVVKKAGRPVGSKDSYKRTRSKKVKNEKSN